MARCGNCDQDALGCLCDVADSTAYVKSGDGSNDDPFTFDPVIDPDIDNLLTCDEYGEGMLAELPGAISNPPAASAYHSLNQSIANNTLTALALNNEAYDTDTLHSVSVSNTRMTFLTPGIYIVEFHCAWMEHQTGNRRAIIRKNGSGSDILAQDTKQTGDGTGALIGHSLIAQEEFVTNDYIEGLVLQTSGAALLLLTDSYSPALSVARF